MKLTTALIIAKNKMFKYIAVDSDNTINAFHARPTPEEVDWCIENGDFEKIGVYTGSKNWKKTLRKVI